MDLGLKGKVALVTGGSEGIGKAAAQSMAAEGATVVICARRPDVLEKAVEEIRKATGAEVTPMQADVTQPQEIESLFHGVIAKYGRIDILVNNAGSSAAAYFEDVTDAAWQADLDLKLYGAIRCSRMALPHMKAQGRRAYHKCNQPGRQGSRPPVGAHVRQPGGGDSADQSALEGLRERQHTGQHRLHRPDQERAERAPVGGRAGAEPGADP